MDIKYDFDDTEFVYDANVSDYIDSLSDRELVEVAKVIYDDSDEFTDEEKADIESNYGGKNLLDDTSIMTADLLDFARDVMNNISDANLKEYFEEDIKDYFEEDAREEYEDYNLETKDPYKYNGVSKSDFM